MNPNYVQAYYYRSIVYANQGIKEASLEDALKAQELELEIQKEYLEALRR